MSISLPFLSLPVTLRVLFSVHCSKVASCPKKRELSQREMKKMMSEKGKKSAVEISETEITFLDTYVYKGERIQNEIHQY